MSEVEASPGEFSASLSGFYRKSLEARLATLVRAEVISPKEKSGLLQNTLALSPEHADQLIENVVGVFGLPLGLGLNMQVNGVDRLLPMAVEEPSIVAAISAASKLARGQGGVRASQDECLLIGQVQLLLPGGVESAVRKIRDQKEEILRVANSLVPRMVARGGGAKELELHRHTGPVRGEEMLVVHLLVDTRDAMGANVVNTMCEGVAPLLQELSGGRVGLRILSNLTDRAIARARVSLSPSCLSTGRLPGEDVRDRIIEAYEFAAVDPYRAATHNKGIMNGIDPIAIATGNDWRAIEAGAHAYAARTSKYTSLTRWWCGDDGSLEGNIALPLKVGTVGGQMNAHPSVGLAHRLLGIDSASELAEVMAAAGLMQNLAALRALATDGIQRGHMALHARSCVAGVGAPPEVFEEAVEALIRSGEVKVWKAKEIVDALRDKQRDPAAGSERRETSVLGTKSTSARAFGKVILFGEHAVVYGARAIALPLPLAMQATVQDAEENSLEIPDWNIHLRGSTLDGGTSLGESLGAILGALGLGQRKLAIRVEAGFPKAVGLGGSAALAVSLVRAIAAHCDFDLDDDAVNELAYQCESIAHGQASGIDNTLATFGRPIEYRRGASPQAIGFPSDLHLVVGMGHSASLTADMVARVRRGRDADPILFDKIFEDIDALSEMGREALAQGDLKRVGQLMNLNHGLLQAIGVSHPELEQMIHISRGAGAPGAKLTGGGGGGAMVALADGEPSALAVAKALEAEGFRSLCFTVEPEDA